VAVSLARGIALTGARVILVDGDLCRPSLSALLSPGASAGFVDVIHDRASLSDAIWDEPGTGMAFLPAGVNSRLAHSSDVLSSVAAKKVFDLLRSKYEYVIVDLSPLAPVVDVRATSHLVDCYLLVIEWGRTTAEMVQRALGHSPAIYERLLGVVLNKTDFKRISGYDATFSQLYGKAYYGGVGPS
jgi:succinoglycan biosynthesis transport protein ExoP